MLTKINDLLVGGIKIVTKDNYFNILEAITFPKVDVISIYERQKCKNNV